MSLISVLKLSHKSFLMRNLSKIKKIRMLERRRPLRSSRLRPSPRDPASGRTRTRPPPGPTGSLCAVPVPPSRGQGWALLRTWIRHALQAAGNSEAGRSPSSPGQREAPAPRVETVCVHPSAAAHCLLFSHVAPLWVCGSVQCAVCAGSDG